MITPGTVTILCACALALGSVLTCFVMAEVASRQLAARDEDHQHETKRLHDEVAYWKGQAARYRASLDGASGYFPAPKFPRPLSHR